ncbi:acetyl-CoA acetyltransferase [Endozoicomonas montiporae]|uniref:Acetyl-CoA acetyltransferase n=2 Tax=Endozoicomonas montiporae TaxID=1027273 RepID=A0A081NBW0_9GAMM|nr:thiolase family protein [Endozoicomonas montiporae]AMO56250.1 acetyl-CoA acetyltransferase [Endozoicomonas montiporae CL-33]KEQ15933.1 acetyl-CoA acetyltransferase [Endozoicomonas montiporae]
MRQSDDIVIVASARTPMGSFQGTLSGLSATRLGLEAVRACLERSGVDGQNVSELIMGCVLPAGVGQAPARQVCRGAGLPDSVGTTTINKVCGSGMKAVMTGCAQLMTNESDVVLAGGMESMSNAPYLLKKARQGLRIGHSDLQDSLFTDGLEDAYDKQLMGVFAEQTANRFKVSREAMDEFAIASLKRAQQAIANGWFDNEITPVDAGKAGLVSVDEQPGKAKMEKIRQLRPAFAREGVITAANSSSISDGAAALLLMRESEALSQGLQPVARIKGFTSHARVPAEFTIAPVTAIEQLFDKTGWSADDVDLFEINEAFAVVTLVAMQELGLSHDKVNVFGGACALGHPLGASGARIIVTLLNALQQRGGKRGVASLCIGGGEATAIALELIHSV